MTVAVTPNLTTIYDGNTAFAGGDTYSGFQRFGSACNGVQVSNETSHFYAAVTPFNLTNKSIYSWMIGPGSVSTLAQGGYRIVIGDGNDNIRAYYVGGSDATGFFVRGWFCFTINGDNLPTDFTQIAGGAPDITNITQVGVGFTTVAKAVGNSPNCFFDISRYGTGIEVRGDTVNPGNFDEIAANDELTTNAWGVFRRIDSGVFGCQGRLDIGSATQASSFIDENSTLFFEGNIVSNDFYRLRTIGNAAGTDIRFGAKLGTGEDAVGSNGVTIQSGRPFIIDFSDSLVEHGIYGCTMRGASNGIIFGNNINNESISTTFDQSGQVDISSTFTRSCIFSGTVSASGALVWNPSINIQRSSFNGNDFAIEYTLDGTFEHNDLTFAGNTNDVNFSGTGDLIINASGISNTSSFIITGSGTVTINNSVSLTFTGLQANSEVRIYDADTQTEVDGIENTSGSFTYTYNFEAGAEINYVIFNLQYQPVTAFNFVLPSNNTSLPIQQVFDRVYNNPV